MRQRSFVTIAVLAALALVSCAKNSGRVFDATLTGTNEVPSVPTPSEAVATFTLNPDGTSMTFELMVTRAIDDASGAHIRLARPGANGPVIVTLWAGLHGKGFTGWLTTGTITDADLMGPMSGQTVAALADSMVHGVTYVNINTHGYPGGHIRGQIYEKP